mmetsp:Transcript_6450/g.9504  ORF Transcript_6450/g.9504 Transcript_6450/m.9504 type:complete len:275 (+) Transcript_6450:80-904(+)
MYLQLPADDIMETLNSLKRQEESCYCTRNGLYDDPSKVIDGKCRELMVNWCYRIADHCHYSHNTISIAINNLDRLIETAPQILDSKRKFQLATMTCLYNAVKTHEPIAIGPTAMARLSKGSFTAEDFETFESILLTKLKWRITAPTAAVFSQLLLQLIPLDHVLVQKATKLVQYQIDHVTKKADYLGVSACDLAYRVTMNAILIVHPGAEHIATEAIGQYSTTFMSEQQTSELLVLMNNQKKQGFLSICPSLASLPSSTSQNSIHSSPRTVTLR